MTSPRRAVVPAAVGLSVFVGLPLVGWGLDDVAGFLQDPPRRAYLAVAAALTVLLAAFVPPPSRSRGDPTKFVRRQRAAVALLQVIGLLLVVAPPWAARRGIATFPAPYLAWSGVGLFAAGQVAMAWAQLALDRQFSLEVTIQERHRLVAKGPYRLVRHPRYLGILLFTLGFALVLGSGVGLALVCAEAAVLLWRIRDEEDLLRREFGAEWEAYARRSWRLVPFAY